MNGTRAELLAGAARAFAERGVRRTTMQSVAEAAGVAKGTLYTYFRTKDEVARALVGTELDRLAGVVAGLPPGEALTVLADEVGAHPVLRRLAEGEPGRLRLDDDGWAEIVRRLSAALGVDDAAADLVGRWLVGVVVQPGRTTLRRRQAAALAQALTPASGPG